VALLNILQFPDKRLKAIASPVEHFNEELQQIIADMFETMYEAQGVGLAATQVNIQQRIIVIDTSRDRSNPLCLINPEITHQEGTLEWEEGCLSFPGVYAKVKRFAKIGINYNDQNGTQQSLEAEQLFSVCIQHEIDHLNGITFYDHLSALKQQMLKKKLKKIREKSL